MLNQKSMALTALILAAILLVAAGSTLAMTMRYNDINSEQSPQGMFGTEFARLVEEKTDGRIRVQTFFGGSLVGYDIEPVQTGIVDFNQLIPSNVADLSPLLSILDAPYVYADNDHILAVMDPRSPILATINEDLAGSGVRILTAYPMGMRNITTTRTPVYSMADLAGLKIRVVPSEVYMATVRAMGATPTPMPFSEVATALTTGVIDGQENPYSVIVPNGLHEVQNYLVMTEHLPTLAGIFMNENTWFSLSAEDQENVMDAALEARNFINNYILEQNELWIQRIVDRGVTIIDDDSGLAIDEIRAAVQTAVYDQFGDIWGALYDELVALGQ